MEKVKTNLLNKQKMGKYSFFEYRPGRCRSISRIRVDYKQYIIIGSRNFNVSKTAVIKPYSHLNKDG